MLCLCLMQCVRVSMLTTYSARYLLGLTTGSTANSTTCRHFRNASPNLLSACWNTTATNSSYPECENASMQSNERGIFEECRTISSYLNFWQDEILQKSDQISEGIGEMNAGVSLLALAVVVLVCFTVANTRYAYTAVTLILFPACFVLLMTLCVHGLTLKGATSGIGHVLNPQWSKIMDFKTWSCACAYVLYSLCLPMGSIHVLSSYSNFSANITRNCLIIAGGVVLLNMTSLLNVACLFGHFSTSIGVDLDMYITKDTDLLFVSIPEMLSFTDNADQWIVVFFVFLALSTFTFLVILVDTISCTLADFLPTRVGRFAGSWLTKYAVCLCVFLLQLPVCTEAGSDLLTILEDLGISFTLVSLTLLHLLAFSWTYDTSKLTADIELMTGKKPSFYWYIMWILISPIFIVLVLISVIQGSSCMATTSGASISHRHDELLWIYAPTTASRGVKCAVSCLPLLPVLLVALYESAVKGGVNEACKSNDRWKPAENKVTGNAGVKSTSGSPDVELYGTSVDSLHRHEREAEKAHLMHEMNRRISVAERAEVVKERRVSEVTLLTPSVDERQRACEGRLNTAFEAIDEV